MTSVAPFIYIDSDLPMGLTLADWRHRHTVERPRAQRGRLRRMLRRGRLSQ
jgi:hypothetical protein